MDNRADCDPPPSRGRSRSRSREQTHHKKKHHRHHHRHTSSSSASSNTSSESSRSSRSKKDKKRKHHHHHHHRRHRHHHHRRSPSVSSSHPKDNKPQSPSTVEASSSIPLVSSVSTEASLINRPVCDLSTAERIINQLLQALPELAPELQLLVQTLDEGNEDIIVKDITNPLVQTGIEAFLVKLGAIESSGAGTGYRLPLHIREQVQLSKYFQPTIGGKVSTVSSSTIVIPSQLPVTVPTESQTISGIDNEPQEEEEDEDDGGVGPQFTSTGSLRSSSSRYYHGPSTAVSIITGQQSSLINSEGLPVSFPSQSRMHEYQNNTGSVTNGSSNGREGWMMNSGNELGSIFAGGRTNRNISSSKESLVTASKPSIGPSLPPSQHITTSSTGKSTATVSRPKSLVELYQEALVLQNNKSNGGGSTSSSTGGTINQTIRRPFDREKDLELRKPVNMDKIIANARSLDDRFTSGTSTTQFM